MKDRIAGAIAAIRRAPNAPSVAAGLCVVVFVVGLWLWRIEHGVDLSDESLYLAFPMRFALGDRPFLDDRGLGQGAGLLVTPIVFLYHLVVRSNAGLVLFMRGCYLGFLLVVGASMARAVRG